MAGYTGDSVCTECGKVLSKGMAIPAAGEHVYQDGACVGCGHAAEKAGLSSISIVLLVLLAGLVAANVVMKLKNKPTEIPEESTEASEESGEAAESSDTEETE